MNSKRGAIRDVLFEISVVSIFLLSLAPAGCGNDTVAYNINPRDAAMAKSGAWERKRYEDILTQKEVPVYGYRVIRTFDHDETAFTEGLVVEGGLLYESAGLWDQSRLVGIDT